MKIIKLNIENFMRIVAVEIAPDGSTVMITGRNGQGKTSVLDAIMAGLCGKKYHPDKPIRDGEEKAEIVIETENYIVTRTFDAKGGSLKVTNAEGFDAKSPQQLLDKIVGEIAFDPMSFVEIGKTEAGRRQQRATLMELAKLDFSDIDAEIVDKKRERSEVKRDKEMLQHRAEELYIADNLPEKLLSVVELAEELAAANRHNADQTVTRGNIINLGNEIERLGLTVKSDDLHISELENKLALLSKERDETAKLQGTYLSQKAGLEESIQDDMDTEEITQKMGEIEATNGFIRKRDEKADLTRQASALGEEYTKLGAEMKDLDQQKATRLADAKMPLEGLSVTDDGVTFDDIPLNQVNDAKLLEIGMGIAMAENPTLKVIKMNGNNLDEDSLEVIKKMAIANDYQIWIERWHGDENGIVIEDGSVKPK